MENSLNKYYELAERAYRNVSFSPEKRAEQTIKDFSDELKEDLQELINTKGETFNYQSKYEEHFCHWLTAESRCLSVMIIGPAKFPFAKNEKNNQAAMNAWDKFRQWREGYFKAVNRKKTLSPEEELDNTLKELDKAIELREAVKGINKIFRDKSMDYEQKLYNVLETYGQKFVDMVNEAAEVEQRCYGRNFSGFAGFEITSNNAKVKRLEEKLNILQARINRKESWEPIKFNGGFIDIEADRVIIKHDNKPDSSVINNLKSRGFRWSPKNSCWCRKHTGQALIDAKRICGVN